MDPDVLRLASAGEFAKSFNGRGIDAGADLEELRRVIGDDESPVVPVFQKGRYQGVVDATSVLRAIARDGRYADHLLVSDFLVKVPLLHPGIDLHTASRIMLRHDVAQILVGNEGVPTALLEQHQIVRAYDDRVRSGATKG
jgi:CBS domain-containing protein